jgi:hypothetical protein
MADLTTLGSLLDFVRGPGYVLDFSDRDFAQFFALEVGIDINDPRYADFGSSKGKRLRRFLQLADDRTATKAVKALWDSRTALLGDGQKDPVANADAKFRGIIGKLGGRDAPNEPLKPKEPPKQDPGVRERLKDEVLKIANLAPQPRGYAFEKFLYGLLELNGLNPRGSFRNRGEQIDGSFTLANCDYLLEAKWQAARTGAGELHSFEGKLNEKAKWARGLFISYVGFTEDGLIAFGRAKRTLCMDGFDLYEMLNRGLRLDQVLAAKSRRAAETGLPFCAVRDLF